MPVVVKANLNGDVRRVRLDKVDVAYDDVRAGVAGAWPELKKFTLKYRDDENDLCTLTQESMEDCVALAPEASGQKLLKLEVVVDADHGAEPMDEEPTPFVPSFLPPAGSESTAAGPQMEPVDPLILMAVSFLPKAAEHLQKEESRQKCNRMGVEKRERLLPVCQKLVLNLDAVPQCAHTRPKLEAYIEGSDPDHLGDLLAELVQIWAGLEDKRGVQQILSAVKSDLFLLFMGGMDADLGGLASGCMEPGSGGCHQGGYPGASAPSDHQQPKFNLGQMLNQVLSEVAGPSCQGRSVPGSQDPTINPLGHIADTVRKVVDAAGNRGGADMAGPAGGTAGGPASAAAGGGTQPPLNVGGLINGLLGGLMAKGAGKGGFGGFPMPTPSAPPAADTDTHMAAPQETPGGATEEAKFEEDVSKLIEMGLLPDRELASEVLRAHNGDLAAVVAMFTA